jgi:hypothetical protein
LRVTPWPDDLGLDPYREALMSGRHRAILRLNGGWAGCSSRVHAPGLKRLEMRFRVLMFTAFLSALAACAGTVAAQPYRARQGVQSGQVRSLDQILNGIRRQRPGSLADVQGPNPSPEGEPRYRLKWITPDGRVLWLDTDARTGRVLGVEGEDRGPPPGAVAPAPAPYGQPPGPVPGYPPGYGRVPQGYPVRPGVPQPQAYGPPPGYGPPPVVGPRVVGPPIVEPRGFILRNGPRGGPLVVPRGGPGRGREFRR